ncbi:MAG TPA: hypothetical protein PK379_06120 [Candidatus Hydrogenedentes bacterium]|nr:hypothetical protein [Candidatus Hydrogenedentota bacterium]HOK89583.1 hypothetical protein [Candidatus Hydrogenedentota bacterium]
MGLSAEQHREIEGYLAEVTRVLQALTSPEKTSLTINKLRERIYAALSNGYAAREDAARVVLERLGDPIRLGVRLARTWGSEEMGPQPPELPAVIQDRSVAPYAPPTRSPDGMPGVSPGDTGPERSVAPLPREAGSEKQAIAAASESDQGREMPRRGTRAPMWLGICAWLDNEKRVPVWVTRPLLVLIGLAGWPVALPLYVAGYWGLRLSGENVPGGRIRLVRLVVDPMVVAVLCGLLYATGWWALYGVDWAASRFLGHPMLDRLGSWNWLGPWQVTFLLVTLAYTLPLAVLGAMPVSDGWSASMRRFTLALVALYGLTVFAGMASLVAGSAFQVAQVLMGK